MGLQIENVEDVFGGRGFLAAKREAHIEVWCEDGSKFLGNAPLEFTIDQIEVAVSFFAAGEMIGVEKGKHLKVQEIRSVLGLRTNDE